VVEDKVQAVGELAEEAAERVVIAVAAVVEC
jgi:hypothetical protein